MINYSYNIKCADCQSKYTSFPEVVQDYHDCTVDLFNTHQRKCLGWRTQLQAMIEGLLHLVCIPAYLILEITAIYITISNSREM